MGSLLSLVFVGFGVWYLIKKFKGGGKFVEADNRNLWLIALALGAMTSRGMTEKEPGSFGLKLGMFLFMWLTGTVVFYGVIRMVRAVWKMINPQKREVPHSHGSATWATKEDIVKLWERIKSYSVTLGRVAGFDVKHNGHMLTCAPQRSGKAVDGIIPNLLTYKGSLLVLDVKGELAAVTARKRRDFGAVSIVDPYHVLSDKTDGINWLAADVGENDKFSISSQLAESLILADSDKGEDHWTIAARELVRGILRHFFTVGGCTIADVRRALVLPKEKLNAFMVSMTESKDFAVSAAAGAFLAKEDRERSSVLSTASAQLSFLDDVALASCMSTNSAGLENLRNEVRTVYLVIPPTKIDAAKRFLRAAVAQTIWGITRSATPPKSPVGIWLDEFAQLGYFKQVEDAVSIIAGYGGFLWLFVQDLSQLEGVYSKWRTFLANCGTQYFSVQDHNTAEEVSRSLGEFTLAYDTESVGAGFGGQRNVSEAKVARRLLTADEVRTTKEAIIFLPGVRPILAERLNYLTDSKLLTLADKNPYHLGT